MQRISRGNHAIHYYFHQNPESPDGTRVVYSSLNTDADRTDIVVCARDGQDAYVVGTVHGCEPHVGACPIWIDDGHVAFADQASGLVHVVRLMDGDRRTWPGGIDEYSRSNRKIIYSVKSQAEGMTPGVHALDPWTGHQACLIDMHVVASFAAAMGRPYAASWHFDHACWSPDGNRLIFEIKTEAKSMIDADFLFHARSDGTEVALFGLKPMHPHWWDDQSIFGHDWQQLRDHQLRRWRLDGSPIEVLAGSGCHGAVSSDRRLVATESWYGADPINLMIFRRGECVPAAVMHRQDRVVRGCDFWGVRSHMHPAFSDDGRRLYFNAWLPDDPWPQVYRCEIPDRLRLAMS